MTRPVAIYVYARGRPFGSHSSSSFAMIDSEYSVWVPPALLVMTEARLKITHVIFDVDGLLIDSERIYTEVNEKLLHRYGVQFTMEMKRHMMGMRKHEAVEWMLAKVSLFNKQHLI